jgi:hypothetical protein
VWLDLIVSLWTQHSGINLLAGGSSGGGAEGGTTVDSGEILFDKEKANLAVLQTDICTIIDISNGQ